MLNKATDIFDFKVLILESLTNWKCNQCMICDPTILNDLWTSILNNLYSLLELQRLTIERKISHLKIKSALSAKRKRIRKPPTQPKPEPAYLPHPLLIQNQYLTKN